MTTSPTALPRVIEVIVIAPMTGWYPVPSGYAETHWLPTVGPTAWVVARRLCLLGCSAGWGEIVNHDTDVLGRMVGVGAGQLSNALGRLVRFGVASWIRPGEPQGLQLLGSWPPISRRQADRISDFIDALDSPGDLSQSQ